MVFECHSVLKKVFYIYYAVIDLLDPVMYLVSKDDAPINHTSQEIFMIFYSPLL